MRSKLLVVAIAAGLGFTSFASVAAPAPQSSRSSSTMTNAEIEQLKAQMAAMQAKLDELEQRTDAQSDINVSTSQAMQNVRPAPPPTRSSPRWRRR